MPRQQRSIRRMSYDELPGVEAQAVVDVKPRMIAPWWHTALVLLQLGALALIGPRGAQSRAEMPHVVLYTVAVMSTWLQLGAVVAGIYRRREFFFDTLQGRAGSVRRDVWVGIGLYFGLALMFGIILTMAHRLGVHRGFDRGVLMAMAPNTWTELAMWLVVSVSVAFCEEHVFRGYLLQQVIAWGAELGASPKFAAVFAVVTTSMLFGSLHLYEGVGGAVLITCLGAVYAMAALWLGNLRAVMVAHVLQDFLAFVPIMARHHRGG